MYITIFIQAYVMKAQDDPADAVPVRILTAMMPHVVPNTANIPIHQVAVGKVHLIPEIIHNNDHQETVVLVFHGLGC